ncbi:MAG: AbrB family transcriptional regulator, partial [Pseudomonadota bacterium]
PGGVTEMSLIALSLAASPVIVAVHHFIRIVCTVFITQAIKKRLV